jgi:filamentous hemagglutinin family protein
MKERIMQSLNASNRLMLCMSFLTPLISQATVSAQIVPVKSDTGTTIQQNQNLINISGGQTSANGSNLFHGFSQFNVNTGQVVNFLSTPNIQNILGRVNGGNASLINGTLQITGSNANLFLMNPAGIVFGANASLNLPASFTATTATGINFRNGQFNAIGNNDYTNLFGNPTAFTFGLNQPGSIVNGGNLAVSSGQNINLVGGTVVSTGTVNAPKGTVNIAAVPGTSLVRISQPGNLLSLEIPGAATVNFTPATLPQLLTGTGISGITVAGNNVNLDRGNLPIKPGDVVVNKLAAGTATVAAANNLNLIGSNLKTTGDLTLRAQNTAVIKDSKQAPLNIAAGQKLLIQGDKKVDIFALNNPQTNISAGGDLLLRSIATVGGDAYFNAGGNFRIEQLNGKLGGLFSPYDPIIRASGDVSFDSYNGASLHIIAGGSVNIPGTITITGVDNSRTETNNGTSPNGLTESFNLADGTAVKVDGRTIPTLDIRAGTTAIGTPGLNGILTGFTPSGTSINTNGNPTGSSITVGGDIKFVSNSSLPTIITTAPVVLLTNQYVPKDSTPGDINVNGQINTFYTQTTLGGAVSIPGTSGPIGVIPITTITNGGDITIVGKNNVNVKQLTTGSVNQNTAGETKSGNILVKAIGNINATGLISTENLRGQTGDITLTSTNGAVTTDRVATQLGSSNFNAGKAGDINISAFGAIATKDKDLATGSLSNDANHTGGLINLTSTNGSIDTANLFTGITSGGNSGAITANAKTNLKTGDIITTANSGNGGKVTLTSGNDVGVGYINTSTPSANNGGAVDITAPRFFKAANSTIISAVGSNNPVSASIYTNGTASSGAITIRHGGNGLIPFKIGDPATNGTNGTKDSIVSSNNNALNPPQSLLVSKTQGNIKIITGTQPPQPPQPPSKPEANCPPNCPPKPPEKKPPVIDKQPILIVDTKTIDIRISENFGDLKPFNKEKPQDILRKIQTSTGVKPAIIYATFSPPNLGLEIAKDKNTISELARNSFQLNLVMVTPNGAPVYHSIPITREKLLQTVKQFRKEVTNPKNATAFMPTAQQLYQWLIAPLEPDLKQRGIQNLVFVMDSGLRGLPMAALHDGKQFLIERYSVGAMPSVSLVDTRYVDIRKAKVLAMGAENTPDQAPLPAVPVELKTIASTIWNGKSLENDQFTATNLVAQRQQQPFGILHLATHGEFKPGGPENSYIQFKNERLGFDRFRQLKLNEPPVELMVLSACRTALGDEDAELGFAGSAARTGVKSVMGSLWYVSDEGTLSLMTSFYRNLQTAPIKAEALRQTQVAMLKGKVRLQQGKLISGNDKIDLPQSMLKLGNVSLTHPFYWSAFTIVGNPW